MINPVIHSGNNRLEMAVFIFQSRCKALVQIEIFYIDGGISIPVILSDDIYIVGDLVNSSTHVNHLKLQL